MVEKRYILECDDTDTLRDIQHPVEVLLQEIIHCMPRTVGNNWEIPKIYEQLHVPRNIHLYGAHSNIHTGPQEHNHIENTK